MRLLRLLLVCAVLSPGASQAATVVVNDLGDAPGTCPTTCTLRAALAAAQTADTIVFDPSLAFPSSLILGGSELSFTRDVTVIGPGPDRLTVSAGAQSRVLQVLSGSVRLRGVALSSGRHVTPNGLSGTPGTGQAGQSALAAEGGCIRVSETASLRLERVALVSCQARGGDAGAGGLGMGGVLGGPGGSGGNGGDALGGAIASFGALTLVDSSIQGALAIGGNGGRGGDGGDGMTTDGFAGSGGDGGRARGAALFLGPAAALVVQNSTLTAGTASGGTGGGGGVSPGLSGSGGDGGAAEGGGAFLSASLALADFEFASLGPNVMQGGPGGSGGGGAPGGTAGQTRGEVVFAATTPRARHVAFVGVDDASDCEGSITASGTNLASDASCGFGLQSSFAQTFAGPAVEEISGRAVLRPLTGSLVIDAAVNCADLDGTVYVTDGVGRPRPQDGDGVGQTLCDLGAFEAGAYLFRNGFESDL